METDNAYGVIKTEKHTWVPVPTHFWGYEREPEADTVDTTEEWAYPCQKSMVQH